VSKKGEAGADQKAFKTWRRRVVEQIICRRDLSPVARVTAYAIADLLNKDTRSTYPFDTLAAYVAEAASGPEASNEGAATSSVSTGGVASAAPSGANLSISDALIAETAYSPDAPPSLVEDLLAEAAFLLKARAPSAKAFCYELVRKYYGKGKLGCVTNSLNTRSEEEVLADIIDVINAGGDLGAGSNRGDLGAALWVP
jgi:hypothetical protein